MENTGNSQINPQGPPKDDALRFTVTLSIFYAMIFAGFGLYLPFFPLWLATKGLNSDEIGFVLATVTFTRMLTVPLVTRLADLGGSIRRALMVSSIACALLFPSIGLANGFWAIVLTLMVTCIPWNPLTPLTDAYGLAGVQKRGLDYGRIRVYGSISFMLANIAGGWAIGWLGAESVVWLIVGTLFLAALSSLTLVSDRESASLEQEEERSDTPIFSVSLLLTMAGAAAIQASHAMFYGFGSLHQRSLGFSDPVIGVMWAIGVLSEIILFWFSAHFYRWFSARQMILLGGLGAMLRWSLTTLDPPVLMHGLLQVLHGASFGLTHLGLMAVLQASVPSRSRASGQGLFTVMVGLGMATASLASGVIYEGYAGLAFHAMTAVALAGLVIVFLAQPQREGAEGKTVDPS